MDYQPPDLGGAGFSLGRSLGNFLMGFANPQQVVNGDGTNSTPTFAQRWQAGQQAGVEGSKDYLGDAAKAKALRQVVQAYAQDEPDPDKAKQIVALSHTQGLAELEGMVQAHAGRMAVQKQQADIQEQLARGQYYQQFGQYRQQQAQDDQTTGQFLQNYLTAPKDVDPDTGEDVDMAPEDRMQYAAKNTPGMSGRILPQIMTSLANWNKVMNPEVTAQTTQFDEDPVSGNRFATRGGVMLPSGTDPAKIPSVPVYSPDGKMFWNGKGWAQLKDLGYPEGSTIKTVNGVNAVVDANGRILKTVGAQSAGQALADTLRGTNAPPAASAAAPSAGAGTNEVARITKDGRKAIFNAKTKQFLRYGN
jgi:hypothetical protein